MNQTEIMEFINKNPVFALATCGKGVPHVRNMMVAIADSRGIIFTTGRAKDVCKQLTANPKIEMCFYSRESGLQLRIAGVVNEVDNIELKKEIATKFDFLKPWIDAQGYGVLATYKVSRATATTWTMDTNDKPKEHIHLTNLPD